MLRTHTCGELRKKDCGKTVALAGWVSRKRSFGKLVFISLRDRFGETQVICNSDENPSLKDLRKESVILAEGKVQERKKGEDNKEMATGEIEVAVKKITILNAAEPLPLDLDNAENNSDEVRLKYRFLDLRRQEMKENLVFRHRVSQAIRKELCSKGFLEIETPFLVRSTPEGARDYLVPSRVHKWHAYALPQSPQIYKQLLMISGFDRYFQLARCFRDEDLRADRQPEFTQVDLEMSFAEQQDVFDVVEGIISKIFSEVMESGIETPFLRLAYKESIERFGTDKPDLRFGLELKDLSKLANDSSSDALSSAECIKCIVTGDLLSRKQADSLSEVARAYKAKGIIAINKENNELSGQFSKFLGDKLKEKLVSLSSGFEKSTIVIVAGKAKTVNEALANVRNELARMLGLIKKDVFKFCWVVDFPLFEWNDNEKRWEPSHHMFTMPKKECLEFLESSPEKVFADCYDLVLNGVELGSGSLRISEPGLQEKVMKVIGLSHEKAREKFGFFLDSFRYGAPPHGGIALGLDRLIAILKNQNDIREFIAFPKNKKAECPMDNSPSIVSEAQIEELGLKLKK
ncbi:MAG TPA: aspartate--tRNA ligase [Candidatus Woesearchaeota archaeon]|nr:aspartate--tRNA ligase [Candidatus Woesearchaeota archaeon]